MPQLSRPPTANPAAEGGPEWPVSYADPMPENQSTPIAQRWRDAAAEGVLLDGFHALKHALRFGAEVQVALTTDKTAVRTLSQDLAGDITDQINALVMEVPAAALRNLVPRIHPTGVAAIASRTSAQANLAAISRQPRRAPVVVLENPRNLGNVGAVVRLAAGLGITGVVTTGDADPWHPNAVRASAGLHYATAVERLDLSELPPGPLYVLDPEGEDIRTTVVPDDALLGFGSERHGVSDELRRRATKLLALPMRPHVSSFNLATSVAMASYHWSATPSRERS